MSEDNLEPLVTQCPNCSTRFRVTEHQLAVAAGRVRCGACLAVFEGTKHLSMDGETLDSVEQDIDVDAVLEELDEIGEHPQGVAQAMPQLGDEDFIAVSEADMALQAGDEEPPEDLLALEAALLDEMKAEVASPQSNQSLDEEEVEAAPEATLVTLAEPISSDAQVDDEHLASLTEANSDADAEESEPQSDNEWADSVANEIWATAEAGQGDAAESTDRQPTTESSESDRSEETHIEDPSVELEAEYDHSASEEVIELTALHSEPPETNAQISAPVKTALNLDPLLEEPEFEEEEPRRARSWLVLLGILVALVALPAQVLWFQYSQWVSEPQYRPIYEKICELAECQLPPMRDVSKIVSKKSIIRAHPEREDARIVDVLLVNTAEFPQPYPLIELMATSIRGQLVAGRRFKPVEYLKGDAKATDLMPVQTPIHVSLEIQDPSEDALNFEVKFR